MGRRGTGRTYRFVDAALLRATAHLGDVSPPVWPDLDDESQVETWCGWLAEVWSQDAVADAVAVASPVLAGRVRAICDGSRPDPAQVRRIVVSVARYLTRMQGRATPFGLFAGVAPLRFGDRVSVQWSNDHHARTRADSMWLGVVIARLESRRELRSRLTVVVNGLVVVRGERLVVPWQPHTEISPAWRC